MSLSSALAYFLVLVAFIAIVLLFGKKSEDSGRKEQEAKQAKKVLDEQVKALGIDDNLNDPEYLTRLRTRFTRK